MGAIPKKTRKHMRTKSFDKDNFARAAIEDIQNVTDFNSDILASLSDASRRFQLWGSFTTAAGTTAIPVNKDTFTVEEGMPESIEGASRIFVTMSSPSPNTLLTFNFLIHDMNNAVLCDKTIGSYIAETNLACVYHGDDLNGWRVTEWYGGFRQLASTATGGNSEQTIYDCTHMFDGARKRIKDMTLTRSGNALAGIVIKVYVEF